MDLTLQWWLVPSFFVVAVLYASVGHGGASGYLAVLSLVPGAFEPDRMASTALTLNVLVAATALIAFLRAGHFSPRLTWPFVIASIPGALVGGLMPVSGRTYALLLAGALAVASGRLLMPGLSEDRGDIVPLRRGTAWLVGAAVGWVSGVVGVGGGIFLSPLLLMCRWADPKQAAGSCACFILVNSLAGLVGRSARHAVDIARLWPLLGAAVVGGFLGARLGANHFSGRTLKRLLAMVLLVASVKVMLMAWRMG